jgi:heme A synthase
MRNIVSYKRTLTICAVVLTLISLRMHIDPAGITENEFPYAKGDAFDVAVTIRHLIGSLLFAIASIVFFAGRIEDAKSQQSILNGCIMCFAVMCITLGTMTVTQAGHLIGGTIVFAVLTALFIYKRVTH